MYNTRTHFLWRLRTAMDSSVTLTDPPFKDGNAKFTTVPLNALSD